jgi:isopentenyl diphosphate isomerase/L-lactate dehydrogenase-like FMN-dependent dehydrogenase
VALVPIYDALACVKQTLDAFNLSGHVKIIAAGKIITGFDIIKVLSLGASAYYCARGMMMALGCIQALICDSGKCPVGVATKEIMEACGFNDLQSIHASKLFRRINEQEIKSFEQIYFEHKGNIMKNYYPFLN